MSRISALWTAGAVAVLFALLVGAVLLRPVLTVDAGDPESDSPTTILSEGGDDSIPVYDDDDGWDEDDEWDDEEQDDDDEEYGDHDEHDDDD